MIFWYKATSFNFWKNLKKVLGVYYLYSFWIVQEVVKFRRSGRFRGSKRSGRWTSFRTNLAPRALLALVRGSKLKIQVHKKCQQSKSSMSFFQIFPLGLYEKICFMILVLYATPFSLELFLFSTLHIFHCIGIWMS